MGVVVGGTSRSEEACPWLDQVIESIGRLLQTLGGGGSPLSLPKKLRMEWASWAWSWEDILLLLLLVFLFGIPVGLLLEVLGFLPIKLFMACLRGSYAAFLGGDGGLLKASLDPLIDASHLILVFLEEAIRSSSGVLSSLLSLGSMVSEPNRYCSRMAGFKSSSLAKANMVSGSVVLTLFLWFHRSQATMNDFLMNAIVHRLVLLLIW